MKMLYKQILSDREGSFIDEFQSDEALIDNVESYLDQYLEGYSDEYLKLHSE